MKWRPRAGVRSGFTLLEVMLAVGIGVVFMGGAVVFLSSTGGDKDLAKARRILENQAGQARENALRFGREQRVVLNAKGIGGEVFPDGIEMDLITPQDLALGRRVWGKPQDYPWLFTGSGLVEPIRVRLRHDNNTEQFS
ncbi:MAG: prepilin-type N-terminal cleavage/methylation domain-containing protein, partial [Verrucomicrobia bacterium]|nr:prepilin-type N-terminal cleavage/methylation domain-containing protein [Verrucomicrobiota bacterium]